MKLALTSLAIAALAGSGWSRPPEPVPLDAVCSTTAAAALRTARAELAAVPPTPIKVEVSELESRRIERVKDRVRELVHSEIECAGPADLQDLAARLASDSGPAGERNALGYEIQRVPGHPDLLAVVATLGIECGADSMLMLYQRRQGGWRDVMVRRSTPYRFVSGGWQELRFAVSPTDSEGGWFVATVSTSPWCTSSWRKLRYTLSRPGPAADRPLVFLENWVGDYMGDESDVTIKVEPQAFELRNNGASLDPEILIRRHVRRFAVVGDKARRIQPVAENARDFADEWISTRWGEADAWSSGDAYLQSEHRHLQMARGKTLAGFASIRDCAGIATEVEIAENGAPSWFLLVRGGPAGPWTLTRTQRQPVAGCNGPNRLVKD